MPPSSARDIDARVVAIHEELAHTGALIEETVCIPETGIQVAVTRPTDTDRLLDQIATDPEQNLPYWAEIWPAGIALAAAIADEPSRLRDRRVLELGCGAGITAAVAVAGRARLTVTDYAPEALALTRLTCLRHAGREPDRALRGNWRDPDDIAMLARGGRYDVVLGADLLYEGRDLAPLIAALDVLLAPAGSLWLAEPGRPPAARFLNSLQDAGWRAATRRFLGPWPDAADDGVVVRTHWLTMGLDSSSVSVP